MSNTVVLSMDQLLYLLDICKAIDSGHCSERLSKKNPERSLTQDGLPWQTEYLDCMFRQLLPQKI